MGGHNSGSWKARGATRVGQLPKLSIAKLRRDGRLIGGTRAQIVWECDGREIDRISLEAFSNSLEYTYAIPLSDGTFHDISERIGFRYTPTPFGGRRQWFACPLCERACAHLYFDQRLRCRHCLELTYESQYQGPLERLLSKSEKIRRRLAGDGDTTHFPPKPSRMRLATYARWRNADEGIVAAWWDQFSTYSGLANRLKSV